MKPKIPYEYKYEVRLLMDKESDYDKLDEKIYSFLDKIDSEGRIAVRCIKRVDGNEICI